MIRDGFSLLNQKWFPRFEAFPDKSFPMGKQTPSERTGNLRTVLVEYIMACYHQSLFYSRPGAKLVGCKKQREERMEKTPPVLERLRDLDQGEGNGFDPTLKTASNHANLVDHCSLRSESSCCNEDCPTKTLLGEMTDNVTDWLKSTRPTTVT